MSIHDHRPDLPSCQDHGLGNCDPYCAKCYRLLRDKYDAAVIQIDDVMRLVRKLASDGRFEVQYFGREARVLAEQYMGKPTIVGRRHCGEVHPGQDVYHPEGH